MIKSFTAVFFCFGILAMQGCKKNAGSNNTNNSVLTGGKGGSAKITIIPEHHGEFVDSCVIYIKYATNDAPANGVYDDSASCFLRDTTPVAIFSNLTTGSYYLLAQGFHAGYVPPYVKGGLPHTIARDNDSDHFYMATYSYNK